MNWKFSALLWAIPFVSSANAELVPLIEGVTLQRNGKARSIDANSVVVPYAQRLFGSSGYDATGDLAKSLDWGKLIKESDYLFINYRSEISFAILGREYRIKQLLIPLPSHTWPSYLYGRSGDKIYAFSKFGPQQLADVVCDEPIGYQSINPYQNICVNRKPSPL